ncbi:MAG: IMP dehydrogenase [Candidatus Aenigmarchaeota archaeon]|nr:IMP dehydrogenase [Candidatus Aenigmarchaeota archaeon]
MVKHIIEIPSRALAEFELQQLIMIPGYKTKDMTSDSTDTSAPLTKFSSNEKPKIKLNFAALSSAMQSVTGPKMAISMAQEGGLGVIFCSQPIDAQAKMVKNVKSHRAGFVIPDTVFPETAISDVIKLSEDRGHSTFPVVDNNGILLGYITKNDFDRKRHSNLLVKDRMLPLDKISVAYDDEINDNLMTAYEKLIESHHGSLPIITREKKLKYAVFKKDIDHHIDKPLAVLDAEKRYVVGAAINTSDYKQRVKALIEAGADILFIDTSQGHTDYVKDTLQFIKKEFSNVPIVGGNIVTREGFDFLAENGADAVKVGMGPGSICITQEQIGVGRGQGTSILEVAKARDDYYKKTGIYIPVIADGGIRVAKDITVAWALGADVVMAGKYFAGCDETPTKLRTMARIVEGKTIEVREKPYWGEGSDKAKDWMIAGRYGQQDFPEGVEAWVPYAGTLKNHLTQAKAMIKDGMRKAGCSSIKDLHENAVVQILSAGSIKEGGVHDVTVEKTEKSLNP